MFVLSRRRAALSAAPALAAALAACAPKPPPPPPPPPPPKVVIVPPKPLPPDGAAENLPVPPVDAAGLRQSVNRNITPNQMLWNLRSAYNVAALNCNSPQHVDLVSRYRAFLTANAKVLTAANKKVDAEFKAKYGSRFVAPREEYMTSVYNHFALPPVKSAFCDAVMAVSRDAVLVKPAELQDFAIRSLPNIEVVFDDFYRRYDEYRAARAAWDAQYGNTAASGTASGSPSAALLPRIVMPHGAPHPDDIAG